MIDCRFFCSLEQFEAAPKHHQQRKSIQSGLLVLLRRRAHHPGIKKKGWGVCFMINYSCRPYSLLRELSLVIVTAVYIPPQADTTTALKELHWTICKLETIYPEAAFIEAGDFNKVKIDRRLASGPAKHLLRPLSRITQCH
jgi:hypothetical protein